MDVDLEGKLRCFTLSDIIQMLSFSGQTGTLTLTQGWNSRSITFEKGRITYIAAATRLPSIEELLLKAGKVSAPQLDAVIKESKRTSRSVIETLLARGFITDADLRSCRDQQLEETIYSLFLWRNCHFSFDSTAINKSDGLPVDLAGERLIMEGTRRVDEWIEISPVVPSVRMVFRVITNEGLSECSQQDKLVFRNVDGARDVVAIAKASGLTQFETAKSLYELVRPGLVNAVPPDKVKIIELFSFLLESIYLKLTMYGYSRVAAEFENQLNKFALGNKLKTRMRGGKVGLSDLDLQIESTALIDLYKLFIAIENNKFSKVFPPDIVHGLVEGLYIHMDHQFQDLMRVYEFYEIEGLLELRS